MKSQPKLFGIIDVGRVSAHYSFDSMIDAVTNSVLAILIYTYVFDGVSTASIFLATKYNMLSGIFLIILIIFIVAVFVTIELLPYFNIDLLSRFEGHSRRTPKYMDYLVSAAVAFTTSLIFYFSYVTFGYDTTYIYKATNLSFTFPYITIAMIILVIGMTFNVLRSLSFTGIHVIVKSVNRKTGIKDYLSTATFAGAGIGIIFAAFASILVAIITYLTLPVFSHTLFLVWKSSLALALVRGIEVTNIGVFFTILVLASCYYLYAKRGRGMAIFLGSNGD